MKGTLYSVDASPNAVRKIADYEGSTPTLDELQSVVHGYIEAVPYFSTFGDKREPCIAFCNEEGKLTGLEPNARATILWALAAKRAGVSPVSDVLAGDVAIVTGDAEFLDAM